jgi:hypothetical protein
MDGCKKEGNQPVHPKAWNDDPAFEDYLKREGIVRKVKGSGMVLAESPK